MNNFTKVLMKDLNHKRAALILQQALLNAGVYAEVYHPGNNYLVQGIDWEARIGFSAGDPDAGIFEVRGCITRDENPDVMYPLNAETILYLAVEFFKEDDFDENEDDFEDEYDYEDDYYDEDEDEDEDDDEDNRVCQFRPRRQRPQRRGRQEDSSSQYAALEQAGTDLIQGLKDVIGNKYKADENGDPAVFEARRAQILEDVVDILRVSGLLKEVKR